jgi:hypothetical protein
MASAAWLLRSRYRAMVDFAVASLRLLLGFGLASVLAQFPSSSPDYIVFGFVLPCIWVYVWPLQGEGRTATAARAWVGLLLFGTGIRGTSSVQAFINGQPAEVVGFGAQLDFVGLDQVNVQISEAMAGAGVVEVYLVVDGIRTNSVTIEIE